MKKIKHLILIIVIAIMIVLSINIVSQASIYVEKQDSYDVDRYTKPRSDSKANRETIGFSDAGLHVADRYDNIFCVQKGKRLKGIEKRYYLREIITISGNTATSKTAGDDSKYKKQTKNINGRLVYAIHNAANTEDRQNLIWWLMETWKNDVGKNLNSLKNFGISKGTGSVELHKKDLSDNAVDILGEAKGYAKLLNTDDKTQTASITQLTSAEKLTVRDNANGYYDDGYDAIGPLKFEFKPDLASITLKDQDGNKLDGKTGDVRNYYFVEVEKKDNKIYSLADLDPDEGDSISSGESFYIMIRKDYFQGISNLSIKLNTSRPKGKTIDGKILFWECEDDATQNMIMVRTEEKGKAGEAATTTINVSLTGNLKIEKVDKNNHNIKLGRVGFTLTDSNGKYVTSTGQITDTKTILYTDEYGNRTINNIPTGSYKFTETFNPNYGYEVVPESITINIQGGQNSKVVENEQKYIKITGKVWEDVKEGKGSTRNNQLDEKEHILGTKKDLNNIWTDNVRVYLKKFERDSNNKLTGRVNTIGNYTTTRDGFYGFDNVEVKYLEDYFVEFEYNGLTYQCVNSGIGGLWENKNSSKAGEDAKSRENLNNKFSIIENGGSANKGVAKDPTENNKIGLDYTINDHVATLNGREDYYKEGWNTTSNTYNAGLNLNNYYKYLRGDNGFNTNGHPVSKVDEISNVNLGLYKREEPDLAVQKDVQNVQVEINGYGHTYNYDRKETLEKQNNEDAFNVGVKFGSKYTEGYELPIYESDSNYINEKDPSKELKVYITYKVRLKNQATTIDSKINSLVDYYDSTYEKNGNCDIRINENINDTDKDGKLNSTIEFSKSDYNDKYKKLNINTKGISIGAGETKCIYIQFGLSRTQIASIINDKSEEDRILKNVVEINSYSSYYKGTTNPYGGIDKDSAPGNAVPGDQSTYEDDTDTAPTLKLEVKEARKLTGKVFLDSTNGTLMTGQIREGDGEYKNGEEGIKDITVTLKPINKDPLYVEYSEKTDENGDFTISGFIPNEYEVIYTWGGQELKNGDKITLDKYKGTAYKERERYTLTGPLWYRQNANKRLTDAIDNYEKRQEIDGRYKSIDHTTENIINNIQSEKMNSTTPKMSIRIENMRKRRKNNYIIIR